MLAEVGNRGGLAQPQLQLGCGHLKLRLARPLLGDVLRRRAHLRDLAARRIAQRTRRAAHPHHRAVAADDAVLHLDDVLAREQPGLSGLCVLAILGIHEL